MECEFALFRVNAVGDCYEDAGVLVDEVDIEGGRVGAVGVSFSVGSLLG